MITPAARGSITSKKICRARSGGPSSAGRRRWADAARLKTKLMDEAAHFRL